MTDRYYPASANRGARFSILARTASVWFELPSSFCCSTDSASSAGPGSTDSLLSMRLQARILPPRGGAHRRVALLPPASPVAATLLHRGEAAHVEPGAERTALAGQYYRSHAFFMRQPLSRGHQRIEHRGIERVHLVRPHQ